MPKRLSKKPRRREISDPNLTSRTLVRNYWQHDVRRMLRGVVDGLRRLLEALAGRGILARAFIVKYVRQFDLLR